jgi:hypothetical protein
VARRNNGQLKRPERIAADAPTAHVRLFKKHPTGLCETQGCGNRHFSKGFCATCYNRKRRGSPLFGQPAKLITGVNVLTDSGVPAHGSEMNRRRARFDRLVAKFGLSWLVYQPIDETAMWTILSQDAREDVLPELLDSFLRAGWIEDGGQWEDRETIRIYRVIP